MDGPSPTVSFAVRWVGLPGTSHGIRNKCCLRSSWSKLVLYIIILCQTSKHMTIAFRGPG